MDVMTTLFSWVPLAVVLAFGCYVFRRFGGRLPPWLFWGGDGGSSGGGHGGGD